MHITCKCLNVSIRSRSTELQRLNIDNVEMTDLERADAFFREDLASVSELETITKEQPGLVEIRNIGSWIIHRCYNCSIYTHAVHREHGAALVLINSNIVLSPEEINKLKSNPDYSSVFRIVINHNLEDLDDYLQQPNKFSVSQLPNTIQVALGGLQQQLEEAVQRQTVAIENKICAFTAEQYRLLEQFRERAHNEHRLLSKLMCRREETNRVTNDMETSPIIPDSFKNNLTTSTTNTVNPKSNLIFNDMKVSTDSNIKHEITTKHSSKSSTNNENIKKKNPLYICTKESASFDTEVLFPFEGIEDTDAANQLHQWSSEEGSDTDDSSQNEGIHMPRSQRDGHSTLAKSLPVTVPAFPSIVRRAVQDQNDDQDIRKITRKLREAISNRRKSTAGNFSDTLYIYIILLLLKTLHIYEYIKLQLPTDPLDPHNIRASIKALAKSVHGDTVFGDLPRPRFSTQI